MDAREHDRRAVVQKTKFVEFPQALLDVGQAGLHRDRVCVVEPNRVPRSRKDDGPGAADQAGADDGHRLVRFARDDI